MRRAARHYATVTPHHWRSHAHSTSTMIASQRFRASHPPARRRYAPACKKERVEPRSALTGVRCAASRPHQLFKPVPVAWPMHAVNWTQRQRLNQVKSVVVGSPERAVASRACARLLPCPHTRSWMLLCAVHVCVSCCVTDTPRPIATSLSN